MGNHGSYSDTRTVREVFAEEQTHLRALPDHPFATDEQQPVVVGKTPYARFDGNDYSVPHQRANRTLQVVASPEQVRLFEGTECVAQHPRSYGKGEQIEDPAHLEGLIEAKRQARLTRGLGRLHEAVPQAHELLVQLAQRGTQSLGSATAALLRLLDHYGAAELAESVAEALAQDSPHPHNVRLILERRQHLRGLPPRLPLPLPDDPRLRQLVVRPHALSGYDTLAQEADDEKP